ncbi:unnamed protein product [Trifolium pratense]|uniref:Uncharacterized protein n=1 Tax=Trifolium pratense TaxID=57577 RepID=A0ACB0KZ65_TRIPR|nr:unnamed protein product [Trifolium pratense]
MGHWNSKSLRPALNKKIGKMNRNWKQAKIGMSLRKFCVWDMPAVKQVLMLSNSGFWIASFMRSDARECTDQFSDAEYLR